MIHETSFVINKFRTCHTKHTKPSDAITCTLSSASESFGEIPDHSALLLPADQAHGPINCIVFFVEDAYL